MTSVTWTDFPLDKLTRRVTTPGATEPNAGPGVLPPQPPSTPVAVSRAICMQ